MSDKDEKINWKKIGAEAVAAAVIGPLIGNLASKVVEMEWRAPDWVTATALWFLDKTPISNGGLVSLLLAMAYLVWATIRIFLNSRAHLLQWKSRAEGYIESLSKANLTKAALEDENTLLKTDLSTAQGQLAEQQKTLAAREFVLSVHEEDIANLTGQIHGLTKERDQLKMQLAAKQATDLASALTSAKKITDFETAIADLQSQNAALKQELQKEMQANTGARAKINDDAARRIGGYQQENAALKKTIDALREGQRRPDKEAKQQPILEQDFTEWTVGNVHWRWTYFGLQRQVYGIKPYCDTCDFELELQNARFNRGNGGFTLHCPKCLTPVNLASPPEQAQKNAIAEIERIIRNEWWKAAISDNETRRQRISERLADEADKKNAVGIKAETRGLGLHLAQSAAAMTRELEMMKKTPGL